MSLPEDLPNNHPKYPRSESRMKALSKTDRNHQPHKREH